MSARCGGSIFTSTSVLLSVCLQLLLAQESSSPSRASVRSSSFRRPHPHQPKLHLMEKSPWGLAPCPSGNSSRCKSVQKSCCAETRVCSGSCWSGDQPGLCHRLPLLPSAKCLTAVPGGGRPPGGPHLEGGHSGVPPAGGHPRVPSVGGCARARCRLRLLALAWERLPQTNHHLCYPYSRGHGPSIILPS